MRIIVIGGTGTIGSAVVTALAARHEVIAVGQKNGTYQVDLASPESIARMFQAIGTFGALVSAAGRAAFASLEKLTDADFQLGLSNKLMGQVNLVRIGQQFINDGGSFTLTGFDAFSGLATTDSTRMLEVSLNPMVAGVFEQVVRINLYGENASGFRGSLGTYEVTLRALVQTAPVPLPAPLWLFGGALGTLLAMRRRQTRTAM